MKLNRDERIKHLFDENSFLELFPDYCPGTTIGFGKINGKKVYLMTEVPVENTDSSEVNEKKVRLLEEVSRDPYPLIIYFDERRIRGSSKDGFRSLKGTAKNFIWKRGIGGYLAELAKLSGLVPTIGILAGNIRGGASIAPPLCDVLIGTKGTNLSLVSSDAVQKVTNKKALEEELSRIEMHCTISGTVDAIMDSEPQAIAWAKVYLSMLPSNYKELSVKQKSATLKDQNTDSPIDPKSAFDMKEVITSVFDSDSYLEIKEFYAREIITAFARMDGQVMGIVASNCLHQHGIVSPQAGRKMAKFISMCDSYSIPLLFLVDIPGFMVGQEKDGQLNSAAAIMSAIACATVPKISIVVRRAYGGGLSAMCGPGFADHFAMMPYASLGAFGSNAGKKPQNAAEEEAHKENTEMLDQNKLFENKFVDGLVEWKDLRSYLCNLLERTELQPRPYAKRIPPL